MTDAIVTDIAEYRAKKLAKDLTRLTDGEITSRYNLVQQINKGADFSDPRASKLLESVFPNGYDPINHVEDNSDALWAEGVRRGVFVP